MSVTYRCQGVVVGLHQPSVAVGDLGTPEDQWPRVPTGRVTVDVELEGGGHVEGFPWGLDEEPRIGSRVLMSMRKM